jgi:hypothetical protein
MTTSAEPRIEDHLEAGELLLWSGRPLQGLRWRPLPGFSLLLFSAALVFGYLDRGQQRVALLAVEALLVAWCIWELIVDSFLRSQTYCGVTDRRILISRGPSQSILAWWSTVGEPGLTILALGDLTDVRYRQRSDGSGSITFTCVPKVKAGEDPAPHGLPVGGVMVPGPSPVTLAASFDLIEEVERIVSLVEEARKAAQT